MNIDLIHVPFSRYGTYFAFSKITPAGAESEGLYLRTVHGDAPTREVFRIDMTFNGEVIPFSAAVTPELLKLESKEGNVYICISDSKTVRIKGNGVGIRLSMNKPGIYDNVSKQYGEMWQMRSVAYNISFMMTPLKGKITADAPYDVDHFSHVIFDFAANEQSGEFECSITEFRSSRVEEKIMFSFDECVTAVKQDFSNWLLNTLPVPSSYSDAREMAAYITWSCVVDPEGNLKRPSMLMSKNWMTNIWSWDHCFNAMAILSDFKLSWDQFMTIFDCQDKYGALPDYINDASFNYNFTKPPVHGWTLGLMMEKSNQYTKSHVEEIYPLLSKSTDWWFKFRDEDKDGFPQYNNGCDSGWDNSTIFIDDVSVESPDLYAFLVIQMEVLSKLAAILDKPVESESWKKHADSLLSKLLSELWDGERFFARKAYSHIKIESQSLLTYMPVILGKRLPEKVLAAMMNNLKKDGKYLTKHGLASESVDSTFYNPDGYWRGPIWAPTTMILVYGLRDAGELEFANLIAKSFCDMAAQNGMAENYNALTGECLRDKAYTWTSSVFLILANELL